MPCLAPTLFLAPFLALSPALSPANPATLAAMQTVAVATEPGVATATMAPATTTTTQVAVTVSTDVEPVVMATPVPEPELEPPPALTGYVPPPEHRYADQIHDDRKSGRGLLAGGLTLAGSAYLFTSLAGALAVDRSRDFTDDPLTEGDEGRRGQRRRAYGQALMVPGIGPALAIVRADTAVRAWAAGVAGLTQAVGVGMALVGIHRLARARRLERLQLSAMGSSRQAHVALQVRF